MKNLTGVGSACFTSIVSQGPYKGVAAAFLVMMLGVHSEKVDLR